MADGERLIYDGVDVKLKVRLTGAVDEARLR